MTTQPPSILGFLKVKYALDKINGLHIIGGEKKSVFETPFRNLCYTKINDERELIYILDNLREIKILTYKTEDSSLDSNDILISILDWSIFNTYLLKITSQIDIYEKQRHPVEKSTSTWSVWWIYSNPLWILTLPVRWLMKHLGHIFGSISSLLIFLGALVTILEYLGIHFKK